MHYGATQINLVSACFETVTPSFISPNPFTGIYRGASILIGAESWIVYYPSTSENAIGSGSTESREQAIREARESIDDYLASFSIENEALYPAWPSTEGSSDDE